MQYGNEIAFSLLPIKKVVFSSDLCFHFLFHHRRRLYTRGYINGIQRTINRCIRIPLFHIPQLKKLQQYSHNEGSSGERHSKGQTLVINYIWNSHTKLPIKVQDIRSVIINVIYEGGKLYAN